MDARELTKRCYALENEVMELKKEIKYLTQEMEKQRLKMSDMEMELKQLSR